MQLRDIVTQVNEKNSAKYDVPLLGLNCSKEFMPSIANIIGTDLTKYKIIRKGEFACSLMQVARDGLVPIRLLEEYEVAIMSSAYFIFKVVNKDVLPEYLMLFFRTKRFDDNAMFYSSGGIRGALSWDRFLDIDVPVPDLDSQKKIVDQYYKIQKAICIKEAINNNLNELIFARYKTFQNSAVPVKTMKLGEIATSVLGGTPSRDVPEYWNGTISWINSGKINDFRIIDASERITEIGLKKSATTLMPKHTVVLAITGATLGQFSILLIDSCANQSVIGILENDKLPYEFIYPYIRFELFELMRKQTGGAQMHINKQNVDDMLIKVPENTALMNWVNIVRPLYLEIENNCFEIEKLNTLSNLLIAKLAQQ